MTKAKIFGNLKGLSFKKLDDCSVSSLEWKGGRRLVTKSFFGVGKWKKDRISKFRNYLTNELAI